MKRRKRVSKSVPAKGRLREMADRLWSRAVLQDWNYCCAVCGAGRCEAHHLIPRGREATRYNLMNGIALCAQHHKFDSAVAPHQNAAGWMLWLEGRYPSLRDWLLETVRDGNRFHGTKNAAYYCHQIRNLRGYVSDGEYAEIVGVKFGAWLEENQ